MTPGVERWFGGVEWTEHTRPLPAPVPPAAPVAPPPTDGQPVGAYAPGPPVEQQPVRSYTPADQQVHAYAPADQQVHAYAPAEQQPVHAYAPAEQQPVHVYAPVPQPVAQPVQPYAAAPQPFGQPVAFGAPMPPPFGQPVSVGVPAGPSFGGRFGGPVDQGFFPPGGLVDEAAVRSARRATAWALACGIFALVVGGGLALVRARALQLGIATGGGRHISTGGLIGGTVALVRAARSYRVMVGHGGNPWPTAGKTVAVGAACLAALLAVVGVVQVARASSLPAMGPAVEGSCWRGGAEGDVLRVMQVRCDTEHEYVGTMLVREATGTQCPADTDSVLDLDDGTGYYLCLALARPTGV